MNTQIETRTDAPVGDAPRTPIAAPIAKTGKP